MYIEFEKNGDLILTKEMGLGKLYSFFDRLRGKGIGSSKLIYLSGLTRFDELNALNTNTAFVNIEPTTTGLILRLNTTNRLAAWGTSFSKIIRITLINNDFETTPAILSVDTKDAIVKLQTPSADTRYFAKYLQSKPFEEIESKISIKLP